ncbi:MAG: hypothetical protein RIT35_1104, partial [Pseudomonadota bacterium]
VFDTANLIIKKLVIPHIAKIFVAYEDEASNDNYAYSGIRVLSPMTDEDAINNAKRLSLTSSSWKNWLINHAIKDGALKNLSQKTKNSLPPQILSLAPRKIYGGRVIVIPEAGQYLDCNIEMVLKDPTHPMFAQISEPVYQAIGAYLNQLGGKLKVTPDFGPNAETADIMLQHTSHVLGISTKSNGSGGKSKYSIISIITALKMLESEQQLPLAGHQLTVIGSSGALGSGAVEFMEQNHCTEFFRCDLQHSQDSTHFQAIGGKFSDECLLRSGPKTMLVTCAYGDEMLNSNWQLLKPGSVWVSAQNNDLPEGEAGIVFARELLNLGVLHIPGQILTIGGTMASWVEWCCRISDTIFSEGAVFEVVEAISSSLIKLILADARERNITTYEAMLEYAAKAGWE